MRPHWAAGVAADLEPPSEKMAKDEPVSLSVASMSGVVEEEEEAELWDDTDMPGRSLEDNHIRHRHSRVRIGSWCEQLHVVVASS